MLKPEQIGVGVLAIGAALGFVAGGAGGLLFASCCLIVGLTLLVSSRAKGTLREGKNASRSPVEKAKVLFLVKEVHARAQRGGKFQEILDPNQTGLELELFLHCWLVNESELPVPIVEGPELRIAASNSHGVPIERIRGDLDSWRLGRLNKEANSWDVVVIRAAQETVAELNTRDPLECGVPRDGWMHFRVRDLTPAEFGSAAMELTVHDAFGNTHSGTANCPRHLPGRMWPFVASSRSVGAGYAEGEAAVPPGA
jgi:hypothetical protein